MNPTPAKQVEDGITLYTLSANGTRKLAFSVIFPAVSLLIIIFFFLTFTPNPFATNVLSEAPSLPSGPQETQ